MTIPEKHLLTAAEWHGGQGSTLYSLASTKAFLLPKNRYTREIQRELQDPFLPVVEQKRLRELLEFVESQEPKLHDVNGQESKFHPSTNTLLLSDQEEEHET